MRACVQRVTRASVTIDGAICGQIGPGLVVLLGVAKEDTADDARQLAEKIVQLRVFADAAGQMNLSLADTGGGMLVVSQFTLLGDCRHGRRPSFIDAAPPELAESLYNLLVEHVAGRGDTGEKSAGKKIEVATGRFRADMAVELVNDGPVTLLIDSRKVF
ncbi:MAG: D-tyrosyl-tRNA(Tyr) deacylase [Planctomycetia bacterium]|nr:D-tyrosyl-tRNA(Tyr) deacylase [Planctomycetia bacterium]